MTRRLLALSFAALLLAPLAVRAGPPPGSPPNKGEAPALSAKDEEKVLYALGLLIGGNVKPLGLSKAELAHVKRGFEHAISGAKPELELQEWGPKVQGFAAKKQQAQGEKDSAVEKEASKGFLAKYAKEKGVTALPSGLHFKSLKAGTGPMPKATDKVKVHYEGKLINGTIFDSSKKRGQPAEFPLNGVIPCWTEGVQKMKVGETAQLVCPAAIAYGDRGHPPTIPGGATLVFEIDLISVNK